MSYLRHTATNPLAGLHAGSKWEVNITPMERVARIVIGLIGMIGGIILLTAAPVFVVGTLEVLLFAAGLDLVVTGATGHCPLYKKLGHSPPSLKKKL
jgi:hypothetical protein